MAGSLGTASLILTADSQNLDKKLGKTEKDVKGWGSRLGGVVSKGIGAVAKGGAMGVGFAAAGMGLESLTEPLDRLKEISKQGDIASAFGLTPEAFTGMSGIAKASGSDLRDFTEGLSTLSGKASEAAAGKGEESQQLFKQLGLDAKEFAKLNPEQQFYGLFEALNKVENPAQRVGLTLKALGEDTGKNFLSVLGKSTAELKAQAAAFSLSNEEVGAAQLANQQYQTASAKLEKASNKLVIAIAPLVEVLADKLGVAIDWASQAFATAQPIFDQVGRGLAEAAGIAGGAWQGFMDIIQPVTDWIGAKLGEAWQWASEQVSSATQWIEENIGHIPQTTGEAMNLVAEGMGVLVGTFTGAESIVKLFVGTVAKEFGKLVGHVANFVTVADAMQGALPKELRTDLSGVSAVLNQFANKSQQVGDLLQQQGAMGLIDAVKAGDAAKAKFLDFMKQGQQNGLNAWDQWAADRNKKIDDKVQQWKKGGGEVQIAVDVKMLKGVEAAVQGSQKWQESIARSDMASRFGMQNKQLLEAQKANVILDQIKTFVARPPISFGIL